MWHPVQAERPPRWRPGSRRRSPPRSPAVGRESARHRWVAEKPAPVDGPAAGTLGSASIIGLPNTRRTTTLPSAREHRGPVRSVRRAVEVKAGLLAIRWKLNTPAQRGQCVPHRGPPGYSKAVPVLARRGPWRTPPGTLGRPDLDTCARTRPPCAKKVARSADPRPPQYCPFPQPSSIPLPTHPGWRGSGRGSVNGHWRCSRSGTATFHVAPPAAGRRQCSKGPAGQGPGRFAKGPLRPEPRHLFRFASNLAPGGPVDTFACRVI